MPLINEMTLLVTETEVRGSATFRSCINCTCGGEQPNFTLAGCSNFRKAPDPKSSSSQDGCQNSAHLKLYASRTGSYCDMELLCLTAKYTIVYRRVGLLAIIQFRFKNLFAWKWRMDIFYFINPIHIAYLFLQLGQIIQSYIRGLYSDFKIP